jgi:rare lipoprotein A
MRRWLVVAGMALVLHGCGWFTRRPAPIAPRPGATQTGVASWYGPGFHGNPTSSGEIYDQNDLTAAHQTLPLGTRVLVTNLENGRVIEVRINDRGPFVDGRIIDLSRAAAGSLGMIGPGTARVRLDVLGGASAHLPSALYAVQVGSFADQQNALRLKAALERRFEEVRVAPLDANGTRYYRVRVGRFARRSEAVHLAQSMVPLGLSAIIVEDGARH